MPVTPIGQVKTLLGFRPGTRMATISKTPRALSLLYEGADASAMSTVEVRALLQGLTKQPAREIRALHRRFLRRGKAAPASRWDDKELAKIQRLRRVLARAVTRTIASEPSPPPPTEPRSFTVNSIAQLAQIVNHYYAPHIPPGRYIMSAIEVNAEDGRMVQWASLSPRYIRALNTPWDFDDFAHGYASFSDSDESFHLVEGRVYTVTIKDLDSMYRETPRLHAQQIRGGEYFPWHFAASEYGGLFTPLALDLAKLGIYPNYATIDEEAWRVREEAKRLGHAVKEVDAEKAKERRDLMSKWLQQSKQPCLYRALEECGLPEDKLPEIRPMFKSRNIAVKNINAFCEKVDIRIKIRDGEKSTSQNNTTYIGTTGPVYEICKTKDHYFAFIEHTGITAYAFENHKEAIAKSPDNWTTVYREGKRDPTRGMSSMALVKKLLIQHYKAQDERV
jgi:hypothetical protein